MCTCVYGRGEESRLKGPPLCYTTGWGQPRYPDSVHIFLLKSPPSLMPKGMQLSGGGYPQEVGPEEEATCALKTGWDI